jgi:hypothetical protein
MVDMTSAYVAASSNRHYQGLRGASTDPDSGRDMWSDEESTSHTVRDGHVMRVPPPHSMNSPAHPAAAIGRNALSHIELCYPLFSSTCRSARITRILFLLTKQMDGLLQSLGNHEAQLMGRVMPAQYRMLHAQLRPLCAAKQTSANCIYTG